MTERRLLNSYLKFYWPLSPVLEGKINIRFKGSDEDFTYETLTEFRFFQPVYDCLINKYKCFTLKYK